ncbi:MAG: arginine--tRNA ligase [Euryarchaeota archaeon HGW-Euryarchaeota-1]|nr:MAG: arginine--tRNA ligase [Euryarchaeota archaeon HGW-Euryarchaeota-1]
MLNFKNEIKEQLTAAGIEKFVILTPPNPKYGDASVFVVDPGEIKEKIKLGDWIIRIEIVGKYLNFFINEKKLIDETLRQIAEKQESFGNLEKQTESVLIEFPGLNPNKAGHIGNARNACLGDSVANVLEKAGRNVTRMDYINDMGVPTAAVFWAIKNLKDLPERKGILEREDFWQGAIYTRIKQTMEQDENTNQHVHKMAELLEQKTNPEYNEEQKSLIKKCIEAQYQMWLRMGIRQPNFKIYESDIVFSGLLKEGIKILKEQGKLYEKEGCLVANLSQFSEFKGMKNPDKILVKSDGVATYTGKDIILQMWKYGLIDDKLLGGKWRGATKAIHVVAVEQEYVMKVLYYILKSLGYEEQFKNSIHLAYGLVGFGGKAKISSREGTAGLSIEEILNEAKARARKIIEEKQPNLSEIEKEDLAEKIGTASVRYYLLKTEWKKDIEFDFDAALDLKGNAAPYLLYTYVRASNILKNSEKKPQNFRADDLTNISAISLIKLLAKYPEVIENAAIAYEPSEIAKYAYALSNEFNQFYRDVKVLGSENEESLLVLVKCFEIVIKDVMKLLGISVVEKM